MKQRKFKFLNSQPCFGRVFLCAIFLFLITSNSVFADSPPKSKKPIIIGILGNEGAGLAMWTPTADYLSEKIKNCSFSIKLLGYNEIGTAIHNKKVDLLICNPAIYIELDSKYSIRAIATGVRWRGDIETQLFGSVIIAKVDRQDLNALSDLKGKRVAAINPDSFGGWIAACRAFKRAGISERDFGQVFFTQSDEKIIHLVRDGTVDIGVLSTMTLENLAAGRNEHLDDFKVIRDQEFSYGKKTFPFRVSTRLYPEWPFAVLPHVSRDLAEDISIALIEMPRESKAAQSVKLRWSVPMSYNKITECLQELQLSPYKGYGKLSLYNFFAKYVAGVTATAILFALLIASFIILLLLIIRLRRTGKSLKIELAERTKAESKLKIAKEAAEVADRAKSEFLAMMSHEIRTPLNSLLGFAGLLKETKLTEEQCHFIEIIKSSGESLLFLINDILDLSKIEAGKIEMERLPFSLRDCVLETMDLLQSQAASKKLFFNTVIPENTPMMFMGDKGRVRQILLNLAGNAVKFTEKGGVELSVVRQRTLMGTHGPAMHEIKFVIKDTGIGIPADRLPELFKPFTQVDNSIHRKFGGTGLGLVVSLKLSEIMGGHIDVISEYGVGSTFTCTLQLEPVSDNLSCAGEDAASPETSPAEAIQLELKALVVDDNRVNRQFASVVLEKIGCQCDEAECGEQAVELCSQKTYDLILMDVRLPDIDGLEATRRIRARASPRASSPFIIALTAHAMCDDRSKCLSAGMDAYLSKPCAPELLVSVIRKAFAAVPASRHEKTQNP